MKTALLILALVSISWIGSAQLVPSTIPKTREVVLNAGDTIQKIHIFIANPSFKPNKRYFYSWYQKQRVLHTQGAWSGKLLEGRYEAFYPNHNLLEQGMYSRGYRAGMWKKWYPDGTLQEQTLWKHGLLHGTYQRFDANGQLIEQSHYRNGQLHGIQTTYTNGDPQKVRYKKGTLVVEKTTPPKKQPKKKQEKKERPKKKREKKEKKAPKTSKKESKTTE